MTQDITKANEDRLSSISELTHNLINGLEVKYDEPVHINMLFICFDAGNDIAAFCAAANISRSTFYCWRRDHIPFGNAYDIAIEKARAYWERYPQIMVGPEFNATYWSMVMRNRFSYTEHRRVKVPGLKKEQNFMEQHQCVMDMLATGETTASEAAQLAKVIASGMQIEEFTGTKKQVEYLMEEYEKQNRRE